MLKHAQSAAPLRVMFYLPVVTPWWFENIVIHLIRVIAKDHEVHVLIPPLWRNTGLSKDQLHLIDDLDHVEWHLLDGEDHPVLRSDASNEEDLIAFVEGIAPDLTLCRSADIKTPARFPGIVRFIMEGAAPPIQTEPAWVVLADTLFDYGVLPELSDHETAKLDSFSTTLAFALNPLSRQSRDDWLLANGLGGAAKVIGLPLEYEHEENFFGQHHRYADNAAMISAIAAALPEGVVLAVTNHPLNELYGDNSAIASAMVELGGKAVLLKSDAVAGNATLDLARHCDGLIVGNSKSWAAGAAFGTPLLRLSDFETGEWMQAYDDLEAFIHDVMAGKAVRPNQVLLRRWFTYHMLDQVFDPADPALRSGDLINRVINGVDSIRWISALARYHCQPTSLVA